MKKITLTLIIFLIYETSFGQQGINLLTAEDHNYTSFEGKKYDSKKYTGKYISLILPKNLAQDDTTVTKMVNKIDSVWFHFYKISKIFPKNNSTTYNTAPIAFVESTCGAGCGFVGSTGIEIGSADWNNLYNNIKYLNNGAILKVVYYEIGRNFYNELISNKLSVDPFWMPEPFANLGYLTSILNLNLFLKNEFEGELTYITYLIKLADDILMKNDKESYEDLLKNNNNIKPFINSSVFLKLYHLYGEDFLFNFFSELYKLPVHNQNIVEAMTNFCIAASKASGSDLSPLFLNGFKMNLNQVRTSSELGSLKKMTPKFIFSEKNHHGISSKDSTKINFKVINDSDFSIEYFAYSGLVGDETELLIKNNSGIMYLKNKRIDFPFWIKIKYGNESVKSEQLNYKYRGNLLTGTSFEFQTNKLDEFFISSSIEFMSQPHFGNLSAKISEGDGFNSQNSLEFNHSFIKNCNELNNSNFPTIDYTQNYIEPFKGKYRISMDYSINEDFLNCEGVVYGQGFHFGLRFDDHLKLGNLIYSKTNGYKNTYLDFDTDIKNCDCGIPQAGGYISTKLNSFRIISYGILGKLNIDNIKLIPALKPEAVEILKVTNELNNDVRNSIFFTGSLLKFEFETSRDITKYKIEYSNDSLFSNLKTILTDSNKAEIQILEPGKYYFRVIGSNEFGDSDYSKIYSIYKLKKDHNLRLSEKGDAIIETSLLSPFLDSDPSIFEKKFTKSAFTCTDLGTSKVTFTAKDATGNTSSAEVTVTVVDEIKPTLKAKTAYTIKLDVQGKATLKWEDIDEGSTDNCNIKERKLSKTEFSRTDGGENKVTYTLTDISGNTSNIDLTVRVDIVLSAPERARESNTIKAYPNPVNDYLYLEFAEGISYGSIRTSSLMDTSGKVLGELNLEDTGNGRLGFSTSNLKNGMYFLRLGTRDTLHLIKFTVIH
jgi:hypothetical protein